MPHFLISAGDIITTMRCGEVTKVMALDYTFDKQLEMERADAWKEGRVAMSKLMNK